MAVLRTLRWRSGLLAALVAVVALGTALALWPPADPAAATAAEPAGAAVPSSAPPSPPPRSAAKAVTGGLPNAADQEPATAQLPLPLLWPPPPPASPSPAPPPAGGAAGSVPSVTQGCAAFPTGRVILISLAAQDLTACQDGATFLDTPVTTGRPKLPTPVGSFSVLSKSSPWTMRSPWPRSSPYWYPPSRVHEVMWFTDQGHGIHDAPWRDAYGPGTDQNGSHGCVNVPRAAMDRLYPWAEVGTPVLIG